MCLERYIEKIQKKFDKLQTELSKEDLYSSNPAKTIEMAREHTRLKEILDLYGQLTTLQEAKASVVSLTKETADVELQELAQHEIEKLDQKIHELTVAVLSSLFPSEEEKSSKNLIIEIRAGTGGEEAALFASDLYRMYSKYAEKKGWKQELLHFHPSELGGLKEIIFSIQGKEAFKKLKYESGVHRVQRVPATESQGRIHTSTATVAVLLEPEEIELNIKPEDLRIEVCRAGGPGGQGVNTTDSAVQIFHIPSGIMVRCQDERSQLKNREKALKILKARLLSKEEEEEAQKRAMERKSMVGSGERTEKIRTYNFPQGRVTDHRIPITLYNLQSFLDGDIDPIIDQLIQKEVASRIAQELAEENIPFTATEDDRKPSIV
ncbi:peptide chain release factor 1 [Methylacidiphilum fumariolicum]|uniref:peptide chain release factor 1 n=1 Tax=Candidatus Methylacidiphilum fumarolicum TaxID=591154 RepID=UPI001CA5E8D7|nr:peptide chain release factor 1 [Candidatus Methylacidiphilum fumarolicum]MBW6415153.1 peptide chain release factor 1 [Candidatus Methylacidiphilum fumarolicum]